MKTLLMTFIVLISFNALACDDIESCLEDADYGDAEAYLKLGDMYYTGDEVQSDYFESVVWYKLAAEQGVVKAQSNLGAMYYFAEGVNQDVAIAHFWLTRAMLSGDPDAGAYRAQVALNMDIDQIQESRQLTATWLLNN